MPVPQHGADRERIDLARAYAAITRLVSCDESIAHQADAVAVPVALEQRCFARGAQREAVVDQNLGVGPEEDGLVGGREPLRQLCQSPVAPCSEGATAASGVPLASVPSVAWWLPSRRAG